MEPLRLRALAAVVIVAGTVAIVGLRWWSSRPNTPPPVPLLLVALLALGAVVVVLLGWRIRQALARRTPIDPIGASRTLVLAQASAITGAIHVGYFVALLALAVPHLDAPGPRAQAYLAGAAIVASGALVSAGLLTQWWCRVPPDDDDRPKGPASAR